MAINSKTKGRAFEYVVRDFMTDTFNSQFERVPLSGALSYLKGDVYAPYLPEFPWTIEAKNYQEVTWNNILTAKSNDLFSFWSQTKREAAVMKKHPLLVYKWNRSKIHCCWEDDLVDVTNHLSINSFGHSFKMGLFSDWLEQAKKCKVDKK
jgi:hypothetical protein